LPSSVPYLIAFEKHELMRIPRSQKSWWKRSSTWLFISDVVVAVAVAGIGGTSAFRFWREGARGVAGVVAGGGVVALVFTGLRAAIQFKERARGESTYDLAGCLQTLRGTLEAARPDAGEPGLRVTLFVPVESAARLEQVCDYACGDQARCKNTAGRKVPSNTGVIGRAYQTNKTAVAKRVSDDPEAHIDDLVKNWGFSSKAARAVDPTVRAWMAVPLSTPERGVEAILYADAQHRDFFTDDRQQLVLGGCAGIALFARQRYT
jgi:hypothetical protein